MKYFEADDGLDIGGSTDTDLDLGTDSTGDTSDSLFDLEDSNDGDTADTNTDDSNTDNDENTNDSNVDANQQKQDETKYKVKYNGEEIELTMDELLVNSQKGLNYDKILTQKQALEQSEEFKILDYYAQQQGMSRQDYTKFLMESKEKQALQVEVDDIKAKSPGISDEIAEEIAQNRIERNQAKLAEKQADEAKQKQAETDKMYNEFLAEYPDVDGKDIPPEIWAKVSEGQNLLTAYAKWENQQLKAKIQVIEKNNKNKSKSTGSVTGDAENNDDDSFLKGLF